MPGAAVLAQCLWRKPGSGGRGAVPGTAASAHVPPAEGELGCQTQSGVLKVPESAFSLRPPREALAPPFLKSLILTVAKALRNTAHCWQLPGGLAI